MRISDWSSDVCSSDLQPPRQAKVIEQGHDTDKRRGVEIAVTNGNALQCACDRKGDQRHANPVQQLVGRIVVAGIVFIKPLCVVSYRRLLSVLVARSVEVRVGKGCVVRCASGWWYVP